jgi:D-alanyl-D-alanine carboxypeptidase (penicillin-binding protein 5/6)
MRPLSKLFAAFILLIFSTHAVAQSETDTFFPTPAQHLIIIDFDSGEILYEKNARTPMQPASMTKIMTASIVFDQLKSGALSPTDEFFVSEDAWRRGGAKSGSSTMFLDLNTKANVADLLRGVIVQSGNDACIVLAEGIAGSEANFAGMMNEKAQELGLESANFKNSTGWPDDEHVISAHDLAVLAAHTIREHPELYKIYAERSFAWNGITQGNRNPLFVGRGFSGADGLKTGHTEVSKYGFVGSAVQDGKRRIFVVNGLASKSERITESMRIMTAAFSSFDSYKLYGDGDEVGVADVYMGTNETVPLVVKGDVSAGLHKAQRPGISVQIKYNGPIPAPITAGDQIAELIISAPKRQDVSIPLYAGEAVTQKSFFARVGSAIINKIRGE